MILTHDHLGRNFTFKLVRLQMTETVIYLEDLILKAKRAHNFKHNQTKVATVPM